MANSSRPLVTLTGIVREQRIKRGTASEHTGVVLLTDSGEEHPLVRLGGNPFNDPSTRALIGKVVEVEGHLIGSEVRYRAARVKKP